MSAQLERLVRFSEALTPQSLALLHEIYAPQARFKDPFNDVTGPAAIEAVFRHMFEQVGQPRFDIDARIESQHRAALEWTFAFTLRGRSIRVRGASVVEFDDDGRVRRHRDYWDPAEELYEKLPGLGALFRALRRRLSTATARGRAHAPAGSSRPA